MDDLPLFLKTKKGLVESAVERVDAEPSVTIFSTYGVGSFHNDLPTLNNPKTRRNPLKSENLVPESPTEVKR